MAYTPTTFTDRAVQYPGRRVLTPVSGQANTVDVTRSEGTVFNAGTKIDAANLNAEFTKIKNEFDVVNALDYANKVVLTTSLDSTTETYTVPSNGIIRYSLVSTTGGTAVWYKLTNAYYTNKLISTVHTAAALTFAQEFVVCKDDIIGLSSFVGATSYVCEFIPYK